MSSECAVPWLPVSVAMFAREKRFSCSRKVDETVPLIDVVGASDDAGVGRSDQRVTDLFGRGPWGSLAQQRCATRSVGSREGSSGNEGNQSIRALYEANRDRYTGTYEEHRDDIEALLLMEKIDRRRREWLAELRKKHGVRSIADP